MNRKRAIIFAGLVCVLIVCIALVFTGPKEQVVRTGELLLNGDFSSLDSQGMPEDWYTDAYVHTPGYTDFSVKNGEITIVNHELNDARFVQIVDVEPDSLYCFSGYVRASASEGLGANLSIDGIYVFSDSYYDTGDEWKEVRLYGRTDEDQTSVTVFARLGGYSGEAIGTASFRDLSLTRVESVPVGYAAYNWYQAPAVLPEDEADGNTASAWPYLVLIALAYLAVCVLLMRPAMADDKQVIRQENALHPWLKAAFMLLLAAAARLVVAILVPGYGVDVGCFTSWANMMAQNGAAEFYVSDAFCDYPPGYILVLGFIGFIGELLGTGATELMIKVPSIACDVAAAALLYAFARKRVSEKAAFTLSALYAFNPLTFIAGAAWGQADSVMALGILLVVILAVENRWYAALPVYMLSVLMKPQALMFGPLGLLALGALLVQRRDKKLIRQTLIGLGLAAAVGLIVVLPFSVKQDDPLWIVELYAGTMGYYDSATVNACNLHFLFGKNWLPIDHQMPWYIRLSAMALLCGGLAAAIVRGKLYQLNLKNRSERMRIECVIGLALGALLIVCVPMQYGTFGSACIAFVVLGSAMLYLAGNDIRHLPLIGGVMLMALCNFGVMMHERYLFAAVLLLTLACVLERDKRVYVLSALLTVSAFLNVGCVLDRGVRIGGVEGHLHAPLFGIESDSAALEYIVSAINCAITAYAVYAACMICCAKEIVRYAEKAKETPELTEAPFCRARHSLERKNDLPRMKKSDWLMMLGVTLVYGVVAFTNLGSTTSPQTMWMSKTRDETVVLDMGEVRTVNMLYFGGIHNVDSDFYIQVSDDGVIWNEGFWAQMTVGDCFKWKYVTDIYEYNGSSSYSNAPREITARYVMITARQLGTTLYEVILRDPETQEVFPASVIEGNAEALLDEQDTFHGEPGWYNSAYFDEIYHARTGYEHYMAMQGDDTYYPYETSHPPLGKVLIAFAISIFGMTPFGWRFAGTLAGVLMLPGMYMLGKWLTRRRVGAFAAMFLMAVDLMHFTQTRIATIDSFVVLFIIWSFAFMVYYIRMDYWRTKLWKTLVPLALSGLFMGLSVASKWTGCYAGVGLAVLFFWSVWRRFDEYRYAAKMLAGQKAKLTKKERKNSKPVENEELLKTVQREGLLRPLITLASCLVFFIAVPLVIYYASYIPYFLPSGGITVYRVIQAAVGDYFRTGVVGGMLGYHGTPGLGMDHPFYSPWYEWPIIGKPMWYYSSTYKPDGFSQTIVAMGNPVVWIGGLAALALVMILWLVRHVSRRGIEMHNRTNDMRPAILLISFAAQYLPWVLVPRGTYIYHYFTSVPFIILCAVLCFEYLLDRTERPLLLARRGGVERSVSLHQTAQIALGIYLLVSLVLFIAFYPYASGMMTNVRWLRMMQWFPNWIYY